MTWYDEDGLDFDEHFITESEEEMTEKQVLIEHIQEYLDSGMWQYAACYLNKTDLEIIIKALEQEPCEDAIDRKLVCAFIDGLISDDREREKGLEYIRHLPPINPQPKTGHWINLNENNDGHCDDYGNPYVKCSECDICNGTDQSDYCPNCGAKMIKVVSFKKT